MTISYDLRIDTLDKNLVNQKITYEKEHKVIRNILDTDGIITVDISAFTKAKALYVESSGTVTVTINGQAILIEDILWMSLQELTSLTFETTETSLITVEVAVFGD
jgi:hypothetical protein